MAENANLISGYSDVVADIISWKGLEKLASGWRENETYERLLKMLAETPERFDGLKVPPSVLIELGLYESGKEAALALEAKKVAADGI